MDKTCKNCKHWGTHQVFHLTWTICENITDIFYTDATADDESNLQSFLVTKPNFGCNQWESKE